MKWNVFIYGGREDTSLDVCVWAKTVEELGAGEILLTSMDRDGTKDGYDIHLTRAISDCGCLPLVASGGAGLLEPLSQAFTDVAADAALAASIFPYGEFTIKQPKEYLEKKGICVRL